MGKLTTPDWILKGKKKPAEKKKQGKTYKVKKCPKCGSTEVFIVLVGEEGKKADSWECKACMWKGKNIEEIARITDLAVSTIYDHLCRLVANDCLSAYEFIPENVIKQILEVKARLPKASKLKEIKEMLPEEITYNEIKCVLADKNLEKVEDAENSEEDDFWEEGYFAETLSSADMKEKTRTFHMKHDEEMNYNCKKCNKKISAHNRDWHAGMCDDCFDNTYYKK